MLRTQSRAFQSPYGGKGTSDLVAYENEADAKQFQSPYGGKGTSDLSKFIEVCANYIAVSITLRWQGYFRLNYCDE